MTIEEAIKHCEEVAKEQDKLCKRYDDASRYSRSHNEDIRTNDAKRCEECAEEHKQLAGWLKELKALKEQASCEDCISRQVVLDGLASIAKAKAKSDAQKSLMGRVMFFTEHLPSVTPQPRMGHWIDRFPAKECKCSVCDFLICISNGSYIDMVGQMKYCPNCGAKMVEPQESEDEE